jgi:hypothetical protein
VGASKQLGRRAKGFGKPQGKFHDATYAPGDPRHHTVAAGVSTEQREIRLAGRPFGARKSSTGPSPRCRHLPEPAARRAFLQ